MSISRNWPQLCLDNISDKEKISKGLFPHQTSYQHLEVRYHLTVIKKLQRVVSSSNFLPALGGKIPFDGNKETSKGLFPHQTSYQHLEVRYHLMLTKKLQGLFPHQTSYQHLEVRYHLMVIKKLH